ncbi:unnamed protein product [Moneuplotes crassus]|uniref:Uncharacterized protein n=1 Tax=Euplotes crassus TaxID=5936 RepID=A0AAD1XAK0_EUPCR|nr:unnamed protein product [Moneuplotes crassus]
MKTGNILLIDSQRRDLDSAISSTKGGTNNDQTEVSTTYNWRTTVCYSPQKQRRRSRMQGMKTSSSTTPSNTRKLTDSSHSTNITKKNCKARIHNKIACKSRKNIRSIQNKILTTDQGKLEKLPMERFGTPEVDHKKCLQRRLEKSLKEVDPTFGKTEGRNITHLVLQKALKKLGYSFTGAKVIEMLFDSKKVAMNTKLMNQTHFGTNPPNGIKISKNNILEVYADIMKNSLDCKRLVELVMEAKPLRKIPPFKPLLPTSTSFASMRSRKNLWKPNSTYGGFDKDKSFLRRKYTIASEERSNTSFARMDPNSFEFKNSASKLISLQDRNKSIRKIIKNRVIKWNNRRFEKGEEKVKESVLKARRNIHNWAQKEKKNEEEILSNFMHVNKNQLHFIHMKGLLKNLDNLHAYTKKNLRKYNL